MMTLATLTTHGQIAAAAALLRAGGVVAFPTETVYGLGADVSNPSAVKRIFEIKGRPFDHPLIVHIADSSKLQYWAEDVPEQAWLLAEHFWPGPLTLILPRSRRIPEKRNRRAGYGRPARTESSCRACLAGRVRPRRSACCSLGQPVRPCEPHNRGSCARGTGRQCGHDSGWRAMRDWTGKYHRRF